MSAGYMIARENFKEASRHVSAETDPVMFNLLYGLQSLTNQIEADFAALRPNTRPVGGERAGVKKGRLGMKNKTGKKITTKATSKAKPRRR